MGTGTVFMLPVLISQDVDNARVISHPWWTQYVWMEDEAVPYAWWITLPHKQFWVFGLPCYKCATQRVDMRSAVLQRLPLQVWQTFAQLFLSHDTTGNAIAGKVNSANFCDFRSGFLLYISWPLHSCGTYMTLDASWPQEVLANVAPSCTVKCLCEHHLVALVTDAHPKPRALQRVCFESFRNLSSLLQYVVTY